MKTTPLIPTLLLLLCVSAIQSAEEEGFVPMFNGKDLTGWVNANCAPETWTVKDGVICCTGKPTGALRTEKQYENFIMEAEWRHLSKGGNSGIFIWGTPISATGQPFLRGIEVQVLENDYPAKGKNEWYTTHGDVFPIHGASMKPIGRSKGQRNFPSEDRSKPSPEWNHYRIECNNGSLRLHVNGKEVSGGDECNYRKGYLALESEGAPVVFKNVRIKELPGTNTPPELTAPVDLGWKHLYNGADLRGWKDAEKAATRWEASDWRLVLKKATTETSIFPLVSEEKFAESEWIFDVKITGAKDAIFTVASFGNVFFPDVSDKSLSATLSKWTRFRVMRKGKDVTVWINDKESKKYLMTDAESKHTDSFTLSDQGAVVGADVVVEFANIFVRELK